MFRRTTIGLITFVFATTFLPAQAEKAFYGSFNRAIDGDSLLISNRNKMIEVRLYGVDCPEYDQPFAGEAKEFVFNKLAGKKVMVKPEYYDSYGRLVAIVTQGDWVVNGELVLSGLAWVYPAYCHKAVCNSWEKNEKSARKGKRGVWNTLEPIPPWEWKRMKRDNS